MPTATKKCEFQACFDDAACGAVAQHEVVWYLWPFDNMDVEEEGNTVARWVWLCREHYQQLQDFHLAYPPTHDLPEENEPLAYTSVVPIGISIKDVTVGWEKQVSSTPRRTTHDTRGTRNPGSH